LWRRRLYGLPSWQGPFCEGLVVFRRHAGDSCPQLCGHLPLVGARRLRAGGGWLCVGVLGAGPGREEDRHQQGARGGCPGGDQAPAGEAVQECGHRRVVDGVCQACQSGPAELLGGGCCAAD
jgi:hypothetical protein